MRGRSRSPNTSAISDNSVEYKCKITFQNETSNELTVRSLIDLLKKIPVYIGQIYGKKFDISHQDGDKYQIVRAPSDFKIAVNAQNFDSDKITIFKCELNDNGAHYLDHPETPNNPMLDQLK